MLLHQRADGLQAIDLRLDGGRVVAEQHVAQRHLRPAGVGDAALAAPPRRPFTRTGSRESARASIASSRWCESGEYSPHVETVSTSMRLLRGDEDQFVEVAG